MEPTNWDHLWWFVQRPETVRLLAGMVLIPVFTLSVFLLRGWLLSTPGLWLILGVLMTLALLNQALGREVDRSWSMMDWWYVESAAPYLALPFVLAALCEWLRRSAASLGPWVAGSHLALTVAGLALMLLAPMAFPATSGRRIADYVTGGERLLFISRLGIAGLWLLAAGQVLFVIASVASFRARSLHGQTIGR